MNKKQIYILIAILGFLAAGVLLRTSQKPRGLVTEDTRELGFNLNPAKAAKIVIVRDGKEVLSAVKQGQGWILPSLWNARASDNAIQSFFNMLVHCRGELRSEDSALLSDFGIADASAVKIQVLDGAGKNLLDLLVGTKRAGAGADFVRRTGSNAVFFSDMNLEGVLGIYGDLAKDPIKPEIMADLEPLKLSEEDLKAVEVRRLDAAEPLTVISLKRAVANAPAPQALPKLDVSASSAAANALAPQALPKSDTLAAGPDADEKKAWAFTANYGRFQLDAQKAESFLRTLVSLKAQGVADPLGSYGLDHPVLEVKIETAKPAPVTVTIGAENADKTARYFRINGDPAVYLLSKYFFDDLSSDDSKLFKKNFLGISPEIVEGMTLMKRQTEKRLEPKDAAYSAVLERLQNLEPAGLLLMSAEKKWVQSPGLDQIMITQKDGKKLALDIGERVEKDAVHGARYAAEIRGETTLFTITEADYDALFEVFKPQEKPSKTASSQTAQNKAQ